VGKVFLLIIGIVLPAVYVVIGLMVRFFIDNFCQQLHHIYSYCCYIIWSCVNNVIIIWSFLLSRIYKSRLWAEMFTELLNIESCDRIPSVCDWREKFEAEFSVKEYSKEYKRINNMMK